MSTYLDLPLTASLVALLTLLRIYTRLDLQLWCHVVGILKLFENSNLFELPSFSSKVFLKLLSSVRPFFTLHSYFRQENIYLMQCAMQCMIVHEWNDYVRKHIFKFVFFWIRFSFEFVLFPLFLGFTACLARVFFTGLLSWLAMLFFWRGIFRLDAFYRITTFSMLKSLWFFDSFIVGKQLSTSFHFSMLDFSLDFCIVNKFQHE